MKTYTQKRIEQDKEITISAMTLIDARVVFVTGAIYKDYHNRYFQSVYTGNFWIADCYELDDELNPIHEYPYPVNASDLIEFIGFAA